MNRCPACGSDNSEHFRFCAECGASLSPGSGQPAGREVRKLVTVLFADVSGSTVLGEQPDPETIRALMSQAGSC